MSDSDPGTVLQQFEAGGRRHEVAIKIWRWCCDSTDLGMCDEYLEFLRASPLTLAEKMDMVDSEGSGVGSFEEYMWQLRRRNGLHCAIVESLPPAERVSRLGEFLPRIDREIWEAILPEDSEYRSAVRAYVEANKSESGSEASDAE